MIERLIKRILIGMAMSILGNLISPIGIILLVIVLVVGASSAAHSSTGPGSNGQNSTQTQQFTGHTNAAVVNAARTLVQFLTPCANGTYSCYMESFPTDVLHYLLEACGNPNCPYAQNGNFQCVFFVLGVYWLAGQPLPYGPDAVNFWSAYQGPADWIEIPANGAPEPGDIAVFSGPTSGPDANPAGHVAIIIDVAHPAPDGTGGYIQLAEANSLKAVDNLPLIQTNQDQKHPIWQVVAWPGYTLMGYIRNASNG